MTCALIAYPVLCIIQKVCQAETLLTSTFNLKSLLNSTLPWVIYKSTGFMKS